LVFEFVTLALHQGKRVKLFRSVSRLLCSRQALVLRIGHDLVVCAHGSVSLRMFPPAFRQLLSWPK
jgi:hypothetical protein